MDLEDKYIHTIWTISLYQEILSVLIENQKWKSAIGEKKTIGDFKFGICVFRIGDWGFRIGDWGKIYMTKTPIPNSQSPTGNFITNW